MNHYSNDTKDIKFHHRMPAQIRFSDVDKFGHVNNSVYFSLYDMCKTQYFYDVVGKEALDNIGIVVANVETNFYSPIFYPDDITIQTAIIRIGTKSFTLLQQAVSSKTGEVKCECKTVMVAYNTKENHSVALPEEYKQKILAYEE